MHGWRRFGGEEATRLRIDEPLVCLIGADEVGKSSLLDAMEIATGRVDEGSWARVDPRELTRDEDLPEERSIVILRYRLDDSERRRLRELESGSRLRGVRWLEQHLQVNGVPFKRLMPTPGRDLGPRHLLGAEIAAAAEAGRFPELAEGPFSAQSVNGLIELLSSEETNIHEGLVNLTGFAEALEGEELEPKLVEKLRELAETEEAASPEEAGLAAVDEQIPAFVRFEMEARQLEDEYELTEHAASPPPALANLAELAELNLVRLLGLIESGVSGSVRARIDAANEVLREKFEAWRQKPPVRVSFDRSGTALLVHVQSGSGVPMKPRERSEGLRQFVALVALMAGEGHEVAPILLIDEAEMHLHYDAQADLMDVLSKQTSAAQVIYTTHSSGCLPEDLGSSVRVVRGVKEEMRSEVEQQFWSDDVGLVPLLLAMGAGSMAFVPLRPAAIAEGPSELVLLPSLLKEAAGVKRLGYQVVPGAAGVPPTKIAGLDLHGVSTAWVLDGDKGGADRRKYLSRNGIPKERIHLLRDGMVGLELEDLIETSTYARAVNIYASDHGIKGNFSPELLPKSPCCRHKVVVEWCAEKKIPEPGKTAIANKVLALRGEERLADRKYRDLLRGLHKSLRKQLKVK